MSARTRVIQRNRPRGVYVPLAEAQMLLHLGWELVDDCPTPDGVMAAPCDEVLLAPPAGCGEGA